MIFKTNLALNNLHCVTPTDPSGEDEPYLWVLFVRADGSNIWQRANDPSRLSANITVFSGSGRPGNLNVSGVKSGGNIHIPPSLGVFNSDLKPITLSFTRGGASVRVFVPGRIAVVCIAIDEDSAPRDAMEGAFNDVKNLVRTRFNDFLNSLNLQTMATQALANPNPANAFQALFSQQVAQFLSNIQREATAVAIQSAEIAVMADSDWWNPIDIGKSIAAGLDPDEPIGSARFIFNEREILDNNLERGIHADLRQAQTGMGIAWYILDGHLNATASFTSVDLKLQYLPAVSQPIGQTEEYTFQRNHICVTEGTKVQISRLAHAEKVQTFVEYPFVNYRYTLDGQVLNGNSGTIAITKDVRFPEFDEDKIKPNSPFIKFRHETRHINVTFEKRRLPNDPQIEQLFLANDPSDGNYDVGLKIEAVLNNGRIIPVGTESIFFEGQTIELPAGFLKQIHGCMENFVGTKWSKSKRLSVIDLWSPGARRRQYEEIANQLDALAEVKAFEKQSVEAAKNIIAAALKIKQR
ncbi:MAG: hypothetical protein WBV94_03535 [Blastocatellia bacterium]